MIVYFIALSFSDLLGYEHNLYKYGANGNFTYSDMNGFGHFLKRIAAFDAYWAAAAVLLAVAGYVFWIRGTASDWRARLRIARTRFTPPVRAVTAAGAVAMAGFGAYIFYNTNILNTYVTTHDREQRQADYEKQYKSLANQPQPKITDVTVTVDLYPSEQRVRMRGRYALQNRSGQPIDSIHLLFLQSDRLRINTLQFTGTRADRRPTIAPRGCAVIDSRHRLPRRLRSHSTSISRFRRGIHERDVDDRRRLQRFVHQRPSRARPSSATTSAWSSSRTATARNTDWHRRNGCGHVTTPSDCSGNGLAADADFIAFDATVGTEGRSVRDRAGLPAARMDGERAPLFPLPDGQRPSSISSRSSRPAMSCATTAGTTLRSSVYYHPGHDYNVDRMIAATKAGLDYFTAAIWSVSAQAIPDHRVSALPDVRAVVPEHDSVFRRHRIHRARARRRPGRHRLPVLRDGARARAPVVGPPGPGADVQGETMLVETLAQYSALMVMKQKYGDAKMRRFLRYELDRYLIGRSGEQKKELPLSRVENQPYIHYRKGSLIMYALADYIGEANLNRAIRAYRDKWAFKGPPFSSTTHLIAKIREVTPPDLQYVLDDFFVAEIVGLALPGHYRQRHLVAAVRQRLCRCALRAVVVQRDRLEEVVEHVLRSGGVTSRIFAIRCVVLGNGGPLNAHSSRYARIARLRLASPM